MFFPALVSILTSYVGLQAFFRRHIPARFEWAPKEELASINGRPILLCGAMLALTLAGLFTGSLTGLPTWVVASSAAAALLAMRALWSNRSLAPIIRGVGWDVILFVVGMFIVAYGLRAAEVTHRIGDLIRFAAGSSILPLSFATGIVSAVCSSVINNHPTATIMAMVIEDFSLQRDQSKLLALAALIGGDLGPKMLPIGSLAALLWFRLLRDRGIAVSYWTYIKIGVPVTLAAVLLSLLVLNAEYEFARMIAS
jgi:arsenical pump membrane protein